DQRGAELAVGDPQLPGLDQRGANRAARSPLLVGGSPLAGDAVPEPLEQLAVMGTALAREQRHYLLDLVVDQGGRDVDLGIQDVRIIRVRERALAADGGRLEPLIGSAGAATIHRGPTFLSTDWGRGT